MIDLKIQDVITKEWCSLDLTENPGFTITKQFIDLQEPTDYFSDYSKTVNIRKTKKNNLILKNIFRLDVGNFDAKKKIPFMLLVNGSKMISGVAKMISVDREFYNLQLSGEMADTMKTLKMLTFREGTPYSIPNPLSPDLRINRDLVKSSWDNTDPRVYYTRDKRICRDIDIIGFCPTVHGYNTDFDSKSITLHQGSTTRKSTLGGFLNIMKGIQNGEDIVGEGLTERQVGEFRSYYQKPYIYVNKLFQIFAEESKKRCNYSLKLDRGWFNNSNRFYSRVVYMLPDLVNDNTSKQTRHQELNSFSVNHKYPETGKTRGIDQPFTAISTDSAPCSAQNSTKLNTNISFKLRAANNSQIYLDDTMMFFNKTRIDPDTGFIIEVYAKGDSGREYGNKTIFIHNEFTRRDLDVYDYDVAFNYVRNDVVDPNHPAFFEGNVPVELNFNAGENVKLGLRARFYDTSMPWQGKGVVTLGIHYNYWQTGSNEATISANNIVVTETLNVRSNSTLTMSRLWPEDKSIYDVILQYCKMFGLVIKVDENTETVDIMSRSSYFKDIQFLDWSDKIDYSTVVVEPAVLPQHYLQLGYGDSADDTATQYAKKYKKPYGSHTVDTDYEFNYDTKKIFEDITPSCIVSEKLSTFYNMVVDWNGLGAVIPVYDSREIYPSNISGTGSADVWGNFYFMSGSQPIDSNLGGALADREYIVITDDDEFQTRNNDYCYSGVGGNSVQSSTIPLISTLDREKLYSLQFGHVDEYYCSSDYVNPNASTIYETFHNRWTVEHYNTQNKIVTADFYLNYLDILTFDFNKFIKVDNNLYIVNKISDFDPAKNDVLTSVQLLQVDNLEAYSENQFNPYIDVDKKEITYISSNIPVEVISSSNWNISSKPDWVNAVNKTNTRVEFNCTTWTFPVARFGRIVISNAQGVTETISIKQISKGGCTLFAEPNVWIANGRQADAKVFDVTSTNNWRILDGDGLRCFKSLEGKLVVMTRVNNSPVEQVKTITIKNDCGRKFYIKIFIPGIPLTPNVDTPTASIDTNLMRITSPIKPKRVLPISKNIHIEGKPITITIDDMQINHGSNVGESQIVLTAEQKQKLEQLQGASIDVELEDGSIISIPYNLKNT